MAGHSKWTQIKRQKEKTDAARSRLFSKLSKLITDEGKKARGNRNAPSLRTAIDRARSYNMPADNIERAIKRATTDDSAALESILYEAYGPGGVALLIEVLTDNRNRSTQEIKHILAASGANLAGPGAAAWAFGKEGSEWKPMTTVELSPEDLPLLEKLVDSLEANDDVQSVCTNAE